MAPYTGLLAGCLVATLISASAAAPAFMPTARAAGPPGATGQLYGPETLEGPGREPVDTADPALVSHYDLVPGQQEEADIGLYLDLSASHNPQPIRGTNGGTDPGPQNLVYEKANPDLYARPGTDSGDVQNAKWPMGLSTTRLGLNRAGFARQQNIDVLPAATAMAGVDMRLSPYAYRELHWHSAGEWSYIFKGSVRVGAVDDLGQTTYDDLIAGDVWFFPAGMPHTIQALDEGTEFLLIFDDGSFSEDATALASELFLRTPKEVLAKDLKTDISAFDDIPQDQLYIFPGTPAPANLSAQNITGPGGAIPKNQAYTYHFSDQQPYVIPGGSIKIIDSTTFPVSTISVALVIIEPGAMREIHWHPTSDEWNFFIAGNARITVFEAPQASQTFDYAEGDVGYIPASESHYIENTGDVPVVLLECLRAPRFTDVSVAQWLSLTPPQVVKDTIHLSDQVIANIPKYKQYIIPGNANYTTTNFTVNGNANYTTTNFTVNGNATAL